MSRGSFLGLVAAGCALAAASAGCGLVGRRAEAGPPPGGWPQPTGGRVTKAMCGLLTDADYASLGHDRQPKVSGTVNDQANTIDCRYRSADGMTVTLEPTADYAEYVFAADLKGHERQLASGHRRSALAHCVVGPADESWFGNGTAGTTPSGPMAHELRLRRGSLLIGITLSGDRGKKEKDPRSVLIALADLVLRRLPHVGAKDTGTAHKIQYAVVGTGRAKSIEWQDYTDVQDGGEATGVRLPWLHTIPMGTAEGIPYNPPSMHVVASSPYAKIGCLIVIDDVPVSVKRLREGWADCEGDFPDSGTGGGSPPSAQPALFRSHPALVG